MPSLRPRIEPPCPPRRSKDGRTGPSPQRALALAWPASVAKESPWRDGGRLAYLGRTIELALAASDEARLEGDRLLLPLPPAATARQIQDAAEAWMQRQALALFTHLVGDREVEVTLAFGRDQEPLRREGSRLRCRWRLIALPLPVIERLFARFFAQQTGPIAASLFEP